MSQDKERHLVTTAISPNAARAGPCGQKPPAEVRGAWPSQPAASHGVPGQRARLEGDALIWDMGVNPTAAPQSAPTTILPNSIVSDMHAKVGCEDQAPLE